jgi:hypothetical protein
VVKLLERALNRIVGGVFAVLGFVVRSLTAAAALVLRRGRHRTWRRGAGQSGGGGDAADG